MGRKRAAEADVLEGFVPVDPDDIYAKFVRKPCLSRRLLEAFLASGEEALAKEMTPYDVKRIAYNLRDYKRRYPEEFSSVGIYCGNGRLTLFRLDE